MPISTLHRVSGPYAGTGASMGPFAFSYKVFKPSDVDIVVTDASGTETTVPVGDYSVTLNANQEATPGGSVMLDAALAVGLNLTIVSDIPATQEINFINQGRYRPDLMNQGLDKLTALIQQLDHGFSDLEDRAIQVPPGETVDDLPPASERIHGILGFDENGDPIILPPGTVTAVPAVLQRREIIAVAGQTSFQTNSTYTVGFVSVHLNGVLLSMQEFTATDGRNVVIFKPCRAGDVVLLESFFGAGTPTYESVVQRLEATATAGQTVFQTVMNYTVGYVGVFLNGVRLSEQEFTATDGVSVVLDEPCALGDIVLIEGFLGSSTGNSAASSAFIQAGAGAVQRTSQNKMREWISVEDFGAVCDGITDDTAAVQAAISAAYNRWAVLRYPLAIRHGPVTVPANVAIVGVGGKSRITAAAGNYNLFTVVGSDVTFENLWIEDSLKTGGWDFVLACGTSTLERIALTNINTWNSFGLISDSGSGANGIHITTRFRSIQARQHRGQGVSMTRLFAFSFWNEVVIDYVNSASANVGAFVFDLGGLGPAAGGLIMRDCDVLGRNDVENNPLQNAFNIRNTAAVWLFGCRADTCGGFGLLLYNVNQFEAVAFSAGLCNNVGIYCENVTNSLFVNTRVFGRNFLTNKAANADGIALSTGCATLVFNGGFIRDCTGHGFNKNAIQAGLVKLNDFVLSSCLGYGLRSAGNSALLTLGCTFNANTAGNYTIGGSFDFIMASQLTSGAVITSVGPGPVSG